MGLVIDTDVWVLAEKSADKLDLARWARYGGAYMSAVTASELLVGVERANAAQRRAQRGAFGLLKTCCRPFRCWSFQCR
jgi:predicted nucleic acid-binding protein